MQALAVDVHMHFSAQTLCYVFVPTIRFQALNEMIVDIRGWHTLQFLIKFSILYGNTLYERIEPIRHTCLFCVSVCVFSNNVFDNLLPINQPMTTIEGKN